MRVRRRRSDRPEKVADASRPFEVLAWPAPGEADLNPYVGMMLRAFNAPEVVLHPFTPRLGAARDADAFLIQWPEAIFEGRGGGLRTIAWLKAWSVIAAASRITRFGGTVALTVHNIEPHRRLSGWQKRLWERYMARLLCRTGLLVGLSEPSVRVFRDRYPEAGTIPVAIVPHPHYRDNYPQVPREEARARFALGDGSSVLGVLGSLRPSKETPAVIAAARQIAGPIALLVAGGADDLHWAKIEHARDGDTRVHLRRGRLSEYDLAAAIAAVDLVLLNQQGGLNSGTALLALSLGRPILAPRSVVMEDLRRSFGAGWVQLFDPPLAPAAIEQAIAVRPAPCSAEAALRARNPDLLSGKLLAALRDSKT